MSDVSNTVDNNDRPRVTSVKIKSKGGAEVEAVFDSISFYTEGQDYSEYSESLSTIKSISISYNSSSVPVPVGTFFQTANPNEGFEEGITIGTEGELRGLGNDGNNVTLEITYDNDGVDTFDVPMSFE